MTSWPGKCVHCGEPARYQINSKTRRVTIRCGTCAIDWATLTREASKAMREQDTDPHLEKVGADLSAMETEKTEKREDITNEPKSRSDAGSTGIRGRIAARRRRSAS